MKKPELPPNGKIETRSDQKIVLDLLKDSKQLELLSQIEKDYPYWDKFKQKTKSFGTPTSLLWKLMKLQRERNINRIKISTIPGFDFKYNTSSKILERLHQFDLNLGGSIEGSNIIPDKEKDRYLISSLMEEAIASSQLEGAVTTREVAKNMLRNKRKPKNLSEKMILNNYLTIRGIIKYKKEPLTPDIIKNLHALITKGTLDDDNFEGRFRISNKVKVVDDITGEVFHTPPEHEHLDKLIIDLCNFANSKNDSGFIHPIIRGIMLHFLIGYIHPFVDGNGRIARTIFYWYLIAQGYWLIEFMSISKIIVKSPAQYARAYLYSEYDENDLTYFIDFNLKSMDLALKSLKEYIARKLSEKKQLFKLIRHENFNERQAEIIKDLLSNNEQYISINEVQNKYGIVYQTARTDLLKLEEMEYLESKIIGKKLLFFRSKTFEDKIRKLNFT